MFAVKEEGLSLPQCLNYKIEAGGGDLGREACVPFAAGVRRRIFGVSNVITSRWDAIQDHG